MLTRTDLVALLDNGFRQVGELSHGKLLIEGEGEELFLTDGNKYRTKKLGDYIQKGLYENWGRLITEMVYSVLVPITVMGNKMSALKLVDVIDELGLAVFHRHCESDANWHATCNRYRREIEEYNP